MIIYRRKPRKLRCLITLTLIVLGLSAIFGVFSAKASEKDILSDQDIDIIDINDLQPVYVVAGDTLWGLVEQYYNYYKGDIRKNARYYNFGITTKLLHIIR